MSDYLLASDAEKDRLRLQARVWEPEAESLFDTIGIGTGWSCADLGCGAMGVLGPLSRRVGPAGKVYGVDLDEGYLAAGREYLDAQELRNVELVRADVTATGLPHGTFDLVHERFLMPYVPPEALLAEMLGLAKPGGLLVLQEPDHHSWSFHPESAKWFRFVEVLEKTFGLRGDINVGRRTFQLLRGAGLADVRLRAAVLALRPGHPYMRMPLTALPALRGPALQNGIATEAELDDLAAEVERLAADAETYQITFTVTQVWGRKPSGP